MALSPLRLHPQTTLDRLRIIVERILSDIAQQIPCAAKAQALNAYAKKTSCRTLFVSDLHLGALAGRPDLALAFLENTTAEHYVLVGDILDLWKPRVMRWGAAEQAVVDYLRQRHADGAQITYITGNHDPDIDAIARTGHFPVQAQKLAIYLAADGRRFLVTHGDDADLRVFLSPSMTKFGAVLDEYMHQFDDFLGNVLRRDLDKGQSVITYLRALFNVLPHVARGHEGRLIAQAKAFGFEGVICGHFHLADLHDQHGVVYANCGDWTNSFTAIAEDHDGQLFQLGARPVGAISTDPRFDLAKAAL